MWPSWSYRHASYWVKNSLEVTGKALGEPTYDVVATRVGVPELLRWLSRSRVRLPRVSCQRRRMRARRDAHAWAAMPICVSIRLVYRRRSVTMRPECLPARSACDAPWRRWLGVGVGPPRARRHGAVMSIRAAGGGSPDPAARPCRRSTTHRVRAPAGEAHLGPAVPLLAAVGRRPPARSSSRSGSSSSAPRCASAWPCCWRWPSTARCAFAAPASSGSTPASSSSPCSRSWAVGPGWAACSGPAASAWRWW